MFQSAPGGEAGGNQHVYISDGGKVLFQSAPGGEAGGNVVNSGFSGLFTLFQSAPGGEAGGNAGLRRTIVRWRCFNPPPAVRPGETPRRKTRRSSSSVSIRPRR